jgi:outer membrane protein assembly factor BamB
MRTLCLLGLLITAVSPATPADPSWPGYRGPNRDGVSAETDWSAAWPPSGPAVAWKAQLGTGHSAVAVGAGLLYSMGWETGQEAKAGVGLETVFCLDAGTGAVVWKRAYPGALYNRLHEGGPAATPALDGPRVYTLGRDGQLFCFDARAGKILWARELKKEFPGKAPYYGFTASPLVLGNRLIVQASGKGASTVALDPATGAVLWKAGDEEASYASPIPFPGVGGERVLVFDASGLVLLDARDGAACARFSWVAAAPNKTTINAATPLLAGDTVFITTGYHMGCARIRLGGAAPAVLWKNSLLCAHFAGPALLAGHLYGFDNNNEATTRGRLVCLDFETGALRWERRDLAWGNVLVAGGRLVALTREGLLVVAEASPKAYREIARAQVLTGPCRTDPVICGGRFYLRNARGDLVCLDVRKSRIDDGRE